MWPLTQRRLYNIIVLWPGTRQFSKHLIKLAIFQPPLRSERTRLVRDMKLLHETDQPQSQDWESRNSIVDHYSDPFYASLDPHHSFRPLCLCMQTGAVVGDFPAVTSSYPDQLPWLTSTDTFQVGQGCMRNCCFRDQRTEHQGERNVC